MIEKYLRNKTIMSIAGIVIGLVLMIWRGRVIEQMIHVVGYILLAAAAIYLLMYFRSSRQNEAQLGYAIAAAAAGILLILLSRFLLSAFPRIIGIVMIVTAAATLLKTYNNSDVSLYSKGSDASSGRTAPTYSDSSPADSSTTPSGRASTSCRRQRTRPSPDPTTV